MKTGKEEKEYSEWLPYFGDGLLKIEYGDDTIQIPNECIANGDLIQEIFAHDGIELKEKCILCPKNGSCAGNIELIPRIILKNKDHKIPVRVRR